MTSQRTPRGREAEPGSPAPGGAAGARGGGGATVGPRGWPPSLPGARLPGRRGCVGLGLQAPVWGVQEEHPKAAEKDAQAGHQQRGLRGGPWPSSAEAPQVPECPPRVQGTPNPTNHDLRVTPGTDPVPAPRGPKGGFTVMSPEVTAPGLGTRACNHLSGGDPTPVSHTLSPSLSFSLSDSPCLSFISFQNQSHRG